MIFWEAHCKTVGVGPALLLLLQRAAPEYVSGKPVQADGLMFPASGSRVRKVGKHLMPV